MPRNPLGKRNKNKRKSSERSPLLSDSSQDSSDESSDLLSRSDSEQDVFAASRARSSRSQNVLSNEDQNRQDLGLPTSVEERAIEQAASQRIIQIERELQQQFQSSGELLEITEEQWRRREQLHDELEDNQYLVKLAEDRRRLADVDEALRTRRFSESDLALITAMREQYVNLMVVSAELHQIVLNRRLLRDRADEAQGPEKTEYEEVIDEFGQIALKPKNLGRVVLQEPDFKIGLTDLRTRIGARVMSPDARGRLESRMSRGLLPASEIHEIQSLSGDSEKRTVVSTNIVRPGGNQHEKAIMLGSYAAGGAIPIAIEQFGDKGVDIPTLSQRALNSAIFVIDPKRLNIAAREKMEIVQGEGELTLAGIAPGAIVAVIIPGHNETDDVIRDKPLIKVDVIEGEVDFSFNAKSQRRKVRITHPDYVIGIESVLRANPDKTLLFHTTRLGNPNPIPAPVEDDERGLREETELLDFT